MYRLFGIFAILTLLCISSTSGHDINYQFTSISVAEGLSQSTAQSILLDKKGKLWIGTKNGLNSYTGQNLKIFKSHPNDRYSLPSNHIIHLTQDSLNDIWISTRQGMVRYDETHGNFIPFNHDIIYSSLCINGGVLFGSENRIYKYDYQKRSFKAVCITPKGATDSDITKYRVQRIIAVSPKEVLIVTRRDGIYILNYPNMQLKRFFSCPNNILQGACLASNGYIYLSFWGQGLFCYEKTGKLIKQYTSNNSGLTNNYVLDIIEKKGYLWLATDGGGINRLELRNEKFSNLYHIAGDENSLPVNSITVLYKDSNECLWAGSVRGGVFNIKESYIRTYKDCPLGYNNGLSEKSVTSFYEEANGKLWIGTDGGGINLYDPQTGNFKHFSSTYGDKVISIAPVSEKELMVSVYTKGLFLFEKNTGIYRPFVIINDSINFRQCFYGYLPRAHRVTENKIYILSKELWVYNINNKKFSPIKNENNYQLQASVIAYCDKKISLAMNGNKVFRIINKNDSIDLLFQLDEKEVISAIDYDGINKIWVGTTTGMGYYDIKEKRYFKIRSQLFNDITALRYEPSSERIWICAQNQLFSYCIKENRFIQWNRSDGFYPNEIIFTYQQRAEKNSRYLYFGGIEGLVRINTDIPEPNEPDPEIALYSIELNGQPYTSGIDTQNIKVPWEHNALALRVYIKNKDIFQRVPFRYIIKGNVDKIIESYNPILDLSNLSTGKYRIEVACMTKDGNYTTPILLTNVHITPPWYKTDWFIILCCISLIGGGIAGIFIFNIKKEARIQKRLKEYRQYLNEKRIDFLIHINHELRTPLTSVKSYLEALDEGALSEPVAPDFIKVSLDETNRMMRMVSDLLSLSRIDNATSHLDIELTNFTAFITFILNRFDKIRSQNDDKKYEIIRDYPINSIWVEIDTDKMTQVIDNIINNAIKYSPDGGKITVSMKTTDTQMILSISDEGLGIPKKDLPKIFDRFYRVDKARSRAQGGSGLGLAIAKEIIKQHNGFIWAKSEYGKGSTFTIVLPYDKEAVKDDDWEEDELEG